MQGFESVFDNQLPLLVEAVADAVAIAHNTRQGQAGRIKKALAIGQQNLKQLQRRPIFPKPQDHALRGNHAAQIDLDVHVLGIIVPIGSPEAAQAPVNQIASIASVGTCDADAAAEIPRIGDRVDIPPHEPRASFPPADFDGIAGPLPLPPIRAGPNPQFFARCG